MKFTTRDTLEAIATDARLMATRLESLLHDSDQSDQAKDSVRQALNHARWIEHDC